MELGKKLHEEFLRCFVRKREIHAEEDGSPEDRAEESGEINFAWIVFIGMQVGYREPELAHMYFGKWYLFEEYKKIYNFKVADDI